MTTARPQHSVRDAGIVRWLLVLLCMWLLTACAARRDVEPPAPVYEHDIDEVLQRDCGDCHAGTDPAGGFAIAPYLRATGCSDAHPDSSVVKPPAPRALLLWTLKDARHEGVAPPEDVERLQAWVEAGAPVRKLGVHAAGILDPSSRDWHGRLASEDHFGPITDASHPDACGRCHAGAPVTPSGVTTPAPDAPACTSCHTQPQGVLACSTCHGDGRRASPPRDRCLFPDSRGGAHAAHLGSSRLGAPALTCNSCHPATDAGLTGTHGNGRVDVAFSVDLAGPDAHYDPETGRCSVGCHNRGGARAHPDWFDAAGPAGCGDCHATPPPDHFAGACNGCHRDLNEDGSALVATEFHMNGHVDVGDGSGGCGACHGQGDDAWPRTPSHALHHASSLTEAITCGDCHPVPDDVTSPGHLDRGLATPADVMLSARASARQSHPEYADKRCTEVACHGAGLPEGREADTQYIWDAAPSAATSCERCHGAPPSVDHPAGTGCDALICHGGEVAHDGDGLSISSAGRMLHIDGTIEASPPQVTNLAVPHS